MNKDPFQEYIKETEPDKRNKGYAWHTAIGLQAVDGLKTSEYLANTAARNIEGEISFEEVNALLQTYYEENPACDMENRTEEADKVSVEDLFTTKTAAHVQKLWDVFGSRTVFGRSDVQRVLGLKSTRSSALLREMTEWMVIEPVSGCGKGKYCFRMPLS